MSFYLLPLRLKLSGMKVILLAVGKMNTGCWNDALFLYTGRLKHYLPFEIEVIPEIKNAGKMTQNRQKQQEGERILKSLKAGDHCVLLDERGREYTSAQFSAYMEKKMQSVSRRLVFITGGPYGFSDEIYENCPERISLSRMTFSHQMIRPLFAEQLYRAMAIIRGEPYHHM